MSRILRTSSGYFSYPAISVDAILTGAVPLFTGVGETLLLGRVDGLGEAFGRGLGEGVGVSSGVAEGVSEGDGVASGVSSGVAVGDASGVALGDASGVGVGDGVGECFFAGLAERFGFGDDFGRAVGDGVGCLLDFFFFGGGGPVKNSFTLPIKESSDCAARPAVAPHAIAAIKTKRRNPFIR